MKIISFEKGQSGDDWLSWRKNGVGASDIGVLTSSNTYKTVLSLWDEKCGFKGEDSINPAMAHGIKNEPRARQWLNENQQLSLEPMCVEDIKHSFFRASLDGYDSEKKVLAEIKCPVSDSILDIAREHRNVPLYWQHQIQWQIMLCKPHRAFIALWDYRHDSCITIEAFAQPTLQKEMREKAKDFWAMVQSGTAPKPSAKDYIHLDDPELKEFLQEYSDHDAVAKAADVRKKELKGKIVDFGDDGNFRCNGYSITRCMPRITYDMKQMRMDGINVEKYEKRPTGIGYYKISVPKI